MQIKELELEGTYVIEPSLLSDNRGYFTRIFCKYEFSRLGLVTDFPQWSISHNNHKNTIRGMHYQKTPHEEIKLVTCIKGEIYDVLVDLRKSSKTYKKWTGIELTEKNRKSLYIPKGIAHGFKTLSDDTDVLYHISEFYCPEFNTGVLYNDTAFGIDWGDLKDIVISERDLAWSKFN